MSRAEMYPWSSLQEVGDFFIVPYTVKPHSYTSMMVNQRNYRAKDHGKQRWTTFKGQSGTYVFLAEIIGEVLEHDFVTPGGVLGFNSLKPGDPPPKIELTVSQKLARLTAEQRQMNLPWWFNDGKFIFNPQIATAEDLDKWYNKELKVGPNDTYPEYYNLDENLLKRETSTDDDEEGFDEFEFDEAPIVDEA